MDQMTAGQRIKGEVTLNRLPRVFHFNHVGTFYNHIYGKRGDVCQDYQIETAVRS